AHEQRERAPARAPAHPGSRRARSAAAGVADRAPGVRGARSRDLAPTAHAALGRRGGGCRGAGGGTDLSWPRARRLGARRLQGGGTEAAAGADLLASARILARQLVARPVARQCRRDEAAARSLVGGLVVAARQVRR